MSFLLWIVCLLVLLFGCYPPSLEMEHKFTANNDSENTTLKSKELTDKESKNLLNYPIEELSPDVSPCHRHTKCIPLNNSYCMNTKLPYSNTTVDLIPEGVTQDTIEDTLYLLQALKHIPKCWTIIQPFLCSIFKPKCVNDMVALPSQEMCHMISGPCRLVLNHTIWPSFIRCDNTELFSQSCKRSKVRKLRFNTLGECLTPLVPTDNALSAFDGVDGCGTQCYDPLYTSDEHNEIHSLIGLGAGICYVFHLLAIVTFIIDWRNSNKYPAVVIFYINACFLIACLGWLAQFVIRDKIICRRDGTLRTQEPSGHSLFCVIVFVLVYYSLMAAVTWFVILTYIWHRSCQAIGKIKVRIEKKSAYFHMIAWCLPLILTVTIMALGEIDGNSMMGICFVGYTNHIMRVVFVLGPISLAVLISEYFLCTGFYVLIRFKISCREIISEKLNSKIKYALTKMGVSSSVILAAVVITVYCHVYEIKYSSQWQQSFRDYMICMITSKYSDILDCKINVRPSTGKLQLQLFALFATGIVMSSWIWTSSTVATWRRCIKRIFRKESEDLPVRLSKHKLIASLFAKRKMLNTTGRLSISFHTSHTDPVGLDFDVNSEASQDISSSWAAALPKLVTRRCALVGPTGSVSSSRRNSLDSEINNYGCVSIESIRNLSDSQLSMQTAQLKTVKVPDRPRRLLWYGKNRSKFLKLKRCHSRSSRGDSTSQDSQLATQRPVIEVPNMDRKLGNAGLKERDLASRDNDVQGMLMRFLISQREHGSSVETVSIEESKHQYVADKNVDEMEKMEKDESDTDSEDSRLEEKVKMPNFEEMNECSRDKTNKNNKDIREDIRNRESRRKYLLQLDPELLQGNNDPKAKNESEEAACRKAATRDLSSSVSSSSSALKRFLQNDRETRAREIATQTSLSFDMEMNELKQSSNDIINDRSPKGTQIPPRLKRKNMFDMREMKETKQNSNNTMGVQKKRRTRLGLKAKKCKTEKF